MSSKAVFFVLACFLLKVSSAWEDEILSEGSTVAVAPVRSSVYKSSPPPPPPPPYGIEDTDIDAISIPNLIKKFKLKFKYGGFRPPGSPCIPACVATTCKNNSTWKICVKACQACCQQCKQQCHCVT